MHAYLEPLLATTITALVVTRALVHPNHHRPLCVRPLSPFCSDLASSGDLCDEIGRRASVAHNLPVGDGHSRVIIRPLSLNRLRG